MKKKGKYDFTLQKTVETVKSNFACKRKNSVVINRLRLRLLWAQEWALDGKCECGDSETVRYILIQCKNYSLQRRKLFEDLEAAKQFVHCALCSTWITGVKQGR